MKSDGDCMLAANVHDFPGFYTPYFSLGMFPVASIAALATKFFCYRRFSGNPNRPDFSDVIYAVCASFLAGMFVLFTFDAVLEALPTFGRISINRILEVFFERLVSGNFALFVVITFLTACLFSIMAEFGALRFLTRDDSVENLFQLSSVANIASYIVQGLIVWAWVTWIW